MPWKKDGDKLAIGADGNPVWVTGDGADAKEVSVSGDTIPKLQREAQQHRTAKEAAEAKLAAFGDLEPTKVREALDKVALIDDAKLIEAGKHQQVLDSQKQQFQAQLAAKDEEIKHIRKEADTDKVSAAFASSKFVQEKLGFGADLAQNMFGNKFGVKEGKVVALDANGQPMTSSKSFGEIASFDEAIEAIVSSHPNKDNLLRGVAGGGTGGGGGGGGDTRKRAVTRAEFGKFNPVERREFLEQEGKGAAQLVD